MHRRHFITAMAALGFDGAPALAVEKLAPGMTPPPFRRAGFDGKPVDLAAFKGKVLLIDFWASWCAPCVIAMPQFRDWQARWGGRGLQVIGISMDDSSTEAKEAMARMKVDYPVVMGDAKLGKQYGGILGLPVEILVGRDGRILSIWRGETSLAVIEKAVGAALG